MNPENYGIRLEPISSNELRFIMPNLNYSVEKLGGSKYIESVKFEDFKLKRGDKFDIKIKDYTIQYKANYIQRSKMYPRTIVVQNCVYNKAIMFVLPLIFDNKELASYIESNNGKYNGYLLNCYVKCNFVNKKDKYSVFCLLKFSKSDRFKVQEDYYTKHPQFIKTHDIHPKYVLYEFSIPEVFREDYALLMQGKYSKISKKAKNYILDFYGASLEGRLINNIFIKHPELKQEYENRLDVCIGDGELWSKFNEDEILTYDVL